jgi:2-polyprenyl-3-methyl-5-hydroxy-6-metoxy-1,4-benzoquinol methylase
MIHVLDHVLAPRRLLVDIQSTLEPGGIIFVVTHDAGSVLARLLKRRWPPFTLQHPQLFSPASIKRLLEGAGFEPLRLVKAINYFPVSHLVRAAVALLGGPAGGIPDWNWPMLGVKLGNIATVARKT